MSNYIEAGDLAWTVLAGAASGIIAVVIHSIEAVRISERREPRPALVVIAAAGAVTAAALSLFGASRLLPDLNPPMLPVASIGSIGVELFYAHSIYGLLRQSGVAPRWRLSLTILVGVELTFGFLDLWLTTVALVVAS